MTKKATINLESRKAQRVSETLHRLEQLGIKLDDPFEVGAYLLSNPDLIDAVSDMSHETSIRFPKASLIMRLYRDPEGDDEYLALYVKLAKYDPTARNTIKQIRDPQRPVLESSKGWFQILPACWSAN